MQDKDLEDVKFDATMREWEASITRAAHNVLVDQAKIHKRERQRAHIKGSKK